MNCSSSGCDAFTISAPVLHRIRPVTHRSVDRATTRSATEPTHSTEAAENVIRFHREGILRAHGAPREVTRRRAAAATSPRRSPWVHHIVRERKKHKHYGEEFLSRWGCVWVRAEEKPESTAVKGISYRGETLSLPRPPGPCCLPLSLSLLFIQEGWINLCSLAFSARKCDMTGDIKGGCCSYKVISAQLMVWDLTAVVHCNTHRKGQGGALTTGGPVSAESCTVLQLSHLAALARSICSLQ